MDRRGLRLHSRVTPCLLCRGNAVDVANFYVSVFPGAKLLSASAISATFSLPGQKFLVLQGPKPTYTIAVSFMVRCKDQGEVDHLWKRLSAGGKVLRCGWLQDKHGLAWQIVPEILERLLTDRDEAKAGRAFQAMLKMRKLDIAGLKRAHAGR